MNQLLAIQVFARVVETSSFTRAADSLDMPKATVSKLIADLESHLGVRLLHRTTRKLSITADGLAYYDRTEPLIRELQDIDTSFAAGAHIPRGRIRVDTGGSFARMVLVPGLPAFLARYPEIAVDLGVTDRSLDIIGENIDCVIRGGPITENSMVAKLVGQVSWVTCAAPSYLEQFGIPRHPNELLKGHRFVAYRSAQTGRILPAEFIRNSEKISLSGASAISINESNAHCAAGVAGIGIIQTFTYTAQPYLQTGELIPVLTDWRRDLYEFHAVYPLNRNANRRVRVFIDWFSEYIAGMQ
ncbi:LysR family transcriptional regulator [Paraburkholderia solisilvae]|uniref:HTH-type transcriptional regulator PgrR n=1 Tax=Paraburkholderia solisilvae TaxID=624376 RepID=A0A6J5EF57_9BURK|nr:LysR family transcriptional regulator [Paraburkholderia solisilvae]CAB3765250.1 HTH-type transcriptional regulator PgrR [Paraburkholderia solisilvae]